MAEAFGNIRGRDLITPMLCLPEHGGMVISMRDFLGREDRIGIPATTDADVGGLAEVSLDKESLKTNQVVILATGEDTKKKEGIRMFFASALLVSIA